MKRLFASLALALPMLAACSEPLDRGQFTNRTERAVVIGSSRVDGINLDNAAGNVASSAGSSMLSYIGISRAPSYRRVSERTVEYQVRTEKGAVYTIEQEATPYLFYPGDQVLVQTTADMQKVYPADPRKRRPGGL